MPFSGIAWAEQKTRGTIILTEGETPCFKLLMFGFLDFIWFKRVFESVVSKKMEDCDSLAKERTA